MTTEFYELVLTPGDDLSKFYGWPAEIAKFDEKRLDREIRALTLRGVYRYKSTRNDHGHDIIEYRGHIIDQSPTGMCKIYRIRPDSTTDFVAAIDGRVHAIRYVNNAVLLRDLRKQKKCYVKYEIKQRCFHITTRI